MALSPGQVIDGKYRVVRRIGEGGMGTVYEGENVRIERRVAIKVLHAQVASQPEFASRFEREARASARIGSPHVCDVLDLGDLPGGERFLVMEFLDGESLEDRVARGKMTAHDLAPIAFEMLEGLGTMHNAGVIHRDLKPANVFLHRAPGRRGEIVKILDFGVAKILPRADEGANMTSTGIMMGTPLYMSPEQARGARDVDARTDLYAASVIFYRALSGLLPYTAENLHELLFKIVLEDPKPLRDVAPEVDEAFAEIVMKGIQRDPEKRYRSAREYQQDLVTWGKTQGRTSLQFTISLPSKAPPLLASLSPSIPKTEVSPAVSGAPVTQSMVEKSGTPTAWSEDAPEAVKKAVEMLHTLPAATAPAYAVSPETVPRPVPQKKSSGMLVLMLVAIGALSIGAFAMVRFISAPEKPTTTATNAPAVTPPPPETAPPVTAVAAPAVEPPPVESVAANPAVAPMPGVIPVRKVNVVAPLKASATPPPPSATAATPPPAASASGSKARKFRTNID